MCENPPNYLCHFWNHKLFFTTQLLSIFLAQTLHTLYKSSPSKCKFSDFPLLGLKFTQFLMSFFEQKVSFSSKFGSFSSVMRDHSSVLFYLKLYILLRKVAHQSPNFQTFSKSSFCISHDHMINESRDLVGEIPSSQITKVIVRATELNDKNIYVLQIGASLCYKLWQLCFITN